MSDDLDLFLKRSSARSRHRPSRPSASPGSLAPEADPELQVSVETSQPPSSRTQRNKGGRPPKPVGERYVDRVQRASFYLDRHLLARLADAAERRGVSKSHFVAEAIVAHRSDPQIGKDSTAS